MKERQPKHCGGCQHFVNEDILGEGWCLKQDTPTSCGSRCRAWLTADGRRYSLRPPSTVRKANRSRAVLLLGRNGHVYRGRTDGHRLFLPQIKAYGIDIVPRNLLGWAYADEGELL